MISQTKIRIRGSAFYYQGEIYLPNRINLEEQRVNSDVYNPNTLDWMKEGTCSLELFLSGATRLDINNELRIIARARVRAERIAQEKANLQATMESKNSPIPREMRPY